MDESREVCSGLQKSSEESRGQWEAINGEVEELRSQNEKLSCQLSEMSGSALQSQTSLKARNESLQKMVHLLQTDLDRIKASLAESDSKRLEMEQDFDSYKVRAQSVLRQAKEKDSAIGAKTQEVKSLERVVQTLNEKISDMRLVYIPSRV